MVWFMITYFKLYFFISKDIDSKIKNYLAYMYVINIISNEMLSITLNI